MRPFSTLSSWAGALLGTRALMHPPSPQSPRQLPAPRRVRPALILALCVAYILAMAGVDLLTPPGMTFGIFYVIAISLATWFVGRLMGFILAVLAAGVWFYTEHAMLPHDSNFVFYWNFCSRLSIYAFLVVAIAKLRALQDSLELKVRQRTDQLNAETAQRVAVEREVAAISHREQERIGHALHDGLGQYLAGLAFRAKALEQSLTRAGVPQAADAAELTGLVSDAIKQARQLARGLAPIELENGDLVPALQNLVAEVRNVFKIDCVFLPEDRETPVRVNPETGLALYHICQEALHNATSHGEPQTIRVSLALRDQRLHLRIRDDGKGYAADQRDGSGMGLRIMKYRAAAIGADFTISSAPNAGTEIYCSVAVPKHRLAALTPPATPAAPTAPAASTLPPAAPANPGPTLPCLKLPPNPASS